ncbi:MAG: T9SS type A sorting domain-containing protein [Bacteroidia bacterium]
MKKNLRKLLASCLLFGATFTNAQSLFYHNNCNAHPAWGDSLVSKSTNYDTTGVTPGAGGTGMNWNFSSLTSPTVAASQTDKFMNPATTTYGSNFPAANMATLTSGGTVDFYKFSPDSITELGSYTSPTNCTYPVWDPFRYTICPFNYGNSYVDHYNSYNCGSGTTYSHNYTAVMFTFDGTGSLTLPTATYSNVIRYKYVANSVDSTFSSPGVLQSRMPYTITFYAWMDQTNPLTPIVFVWETISYPSFGYFGKVVVAINYTHYPATTTVGIENVEKNNVVGLFPVPATNTVNLEIPDNFKIQSTKIYDCLGRNVKETGSTASIDVSNLQSGIYFVEVKAETGKIFKNKFTKE